MEIKPGKFVAVSYKLYGSQNNQPEEELEETRPGEPFTFLYGLGSMLESFEKKIEGMKQGDKFDFVVPSEEAFGDVNPEMIFDLPKDIFKNAEGQFDAESVVVGAILPMQNQDGQIVNGKVMEITDTVVKMNFNHPFAGADLHFIGEVEVVRDPTEEDIHELQAGMSGGCGCDSCGEGGCGDHDHEHGEGGCCGGGCH